jgi:hypothetical protein
MREMLEMWRGCGGRIEIRMCTMIVHGLIRHIGKTVLRGLWSSRPRMLHWYKI